MWCHNLKRSLDDNNPEKNTEYGRRTNQRETLRVPREICRVSRNPYMGKDRESQIVSYYFYITISD